MSDGTTCGGCGRTVTDVNASEDGETCLFCETEGVRHD
jgi:hypothetical protein